jgi:hypothetical protein
MSSSGSLEMRVGSLLFLYLEREARIKKKQIGKPVLFCQMEPFRQPLTKDQALL